METTKTLSASSIKCLETCSWLYWNQYEKKVPQKTNDGALRGTVVHTIFEVLINPRHHHHVHELIAKKSVNGSPAVRRLLIKLLGEQNILNVTNFEMCDEMIVVGLKTDFFGRGGKLGKPEFKFELVNEDPLYKIRGYIDKLVFYDGGRMKIVDYKSSKSKFSGDELTANIQSMAYSLVGYKMFNAKDVTAEFVFLRYPNAPVQSVHFSRQELAGFEQYLAYIYQLINPFTEDKAITNLAANSQKNKWLCKAGATWECPYYRPFKYYALVDENGKVARTALSEDQLTPESGQTMVSKEYLGCPAYPQTSAIGEL